MSVVDPEDHMEVDLMKRIALVVLPVVLSFLAVGVAFLVLRVRPEGLLPRKAEHLAVEPETPAAVAPAAEEKAR
jgi:hypothetical protein